MKNYLQGIHIGENHKLTIIYHRLLDENIHNILLTVKSIALIFELLL